MMRKFETDNMKNVNIDLLIAHVFKLWTKSKKQTLDEFGLTTPQFEILSAINYLSNYKKKIIQTDLSEETGIDPMTTSTILRNLEKKKIITRVRGTSNARVIYVELTKTGKSLYEMASSKMSLRCDNLYSTIDEKNLTSQLFLLSNELNKLNN